MTERMLEGGERREERGVRREEGGGRIRRAEPVECFAD